MIVENMSSLIDDVVTKSMANQKTSIASNLNQIIATWLQEITPVFESLALEIEQVFGIPDNVALPEDLIYEKNTPNEIPQLKTEMKELLGEYLKQLAFREMLKNELGILNGIEPVFEKVKQFVKKCDNATKEGKNIRQGLGELEQQLKDCKLPNEEQGETESYELMTKFIK